MGWILNVSMQRVIDGDHVNPGKNSMLIQIVNPDMEFPVPKFKFSVVHQFKFLDLEATDDWGHSEKITDTQAKEIVDALSFAIKNDMNVIVHCIVGACRSGAVCEVGVMMGLKDRNAHRIPNLLVKYKLMKVLGYCYE